MGSVNKSVADEDAVSCLLLGTESRELYVVDTQVFALLTKVRLSTRLLLF